MADTPTEASADGRFPGQRLSGPQELLEGQVLHKRSCGNKLLFLELDTRQPKNSVQLPSTAQSWEAIFSFEVYGTEVREVRKQVSVGDTISCKGTWRACGKILDVFSYSMLRRWADIGGGETFAAPAARKVDEVGRSLANTKMPQSSNDCTMNEVPPRPPAPESTARRRALCKFWMSNGICRRTQCNCYHPEGDELKAARVRWRQEQFQRVASNAQPDDPHPEQEKKGHAARAAVFAEWLCEVFGDDLLRGGVVDIAGGRGELAFELSVKNIPCIVLDPRCPGGDRPVPWNDWHVSRQQRLWLKSQCGLRSYAECQAHVLGCPVRQCQVPVETAIENARTWMKKSSEAAPEWEDLCSCQVVVGLHPDQATGGVIELAKELGRPFAVVPCCTFADEFPERHLEHRPVRTYADLIEWLQVTAGPATRKDFLRFFGKNLVLFSR